MADVKELNINNTTYDIKAKSVVDQNSGSVKMWTGTRQQYDAILSKDANTLYNITDDDTSLGDVVTDLNGKADVDLGNCSDVGNTKMAKASMPSNTNIALTIGAAGTQYTAPADGWYQASGTANASVGYIYLTNNSSALADMKQVGQSVVSHCYIPAKKGDTITLWWQGMNMSTFLFIYAVGSEWEAS